MNRREIEGEIRATQRTVETFIELAYKLDLGAGIVEHVLEELIDNRLFTLHEQLLKAPVNFSPEQERIGK